MAIFWPFQIYTSLFGQNCWEKFRMIIFGHSKFIPVFLGKIVGKNSEWPFLAIPNLYQSFWEKLSEKIENGHFWPFQNLYQSFWAKLLGKIQNDHFWPFQICTSLFGKNCQKKFRMAISGHSKFISVFLGKLLGKIWNNHFWPFQIYTSLCWKNCWKKFGTAIFSHSEFFLTIFL